MPKSNIRSSYQASDGIAEGANKCDSIGGLPVENRSRGKRAGRKWRNRSSKLSVSVETTICVPIGSNTYFEHILAGLARLLRLFNLLDRSCSVFINFSLIPAFRNEPSTEIRVGGWSSFVRRAEEWISRVGLMHLLGSGESFPSCFTRGR